MTFLKDNVAYFKCNFLTGHHWGSVALTLILAEKRPLKGLMLDGVEPTVAAMESNRYPYAKPLFVVTRNDASASVREVVDFLHSVQGKAMLLDLGVSASKPTL